MIDDLRHMAVVFELQDHEVSIVVFEIHATSMEAQCSFKLQASIMASLEETEGLNLTQCLVFQER